jgi:hypothetical protein
MLVGTTARTLIDPGLRAPSLEGVASGEPGRGTRQENLVVRVKVGGVLREDGGGDGRAATTNRKKKEL